MFRLLSLFRLQLLVVASSGQQSGKKIVRELVDNGPLTSGSLWQLSENDVFGALETRKSPPRVTKNVFCRDLSKSHDAKTVDGDSFSQAIMSTGLQLKYLQRVTTMFS